MIACRRLQKADLSDVLSLMMEVIYDMNQRFNVPMVFSMSKIKDEFDLHLKDPRHIAYGCFNKQTTSAPDVLLGVGVFVMGATYHEKNTISFVEKILHPDPTLHPTRQARVMVQLIRFIEDVSQGIKAPSYVCISAQANTGLPSYLERKGYGDKEISLRKHINKEALSHG